RGLPLRVVDLKYESSGSPGYRVVRETEKKYTFLKEAGQANNYQHVNIRVSPSFQGGATFKTVSEAFYMHESIERLVVPQGEVVTITTYEQNPLNLAI